MEAKTIGKTLLSYREAMEHTGLGRTLLTKLVATGELPAARGNAVCGTSAGHHGVD